MIEIDIGQLTPTLLTILCSSLATGVSVYVAMSNRIVVLETQMRQLLDQVKEANSDSKLIIKLERDLKTAFESIDELRADIDALSRREQDGEMALARLQTVCNSINKRS